MDYSAQAYLRRVSTQKLKAFLEKYRLGEIQETYDIEPIVKELARRKKEEKQTSSSSEEEV